MTDTPLGRVFRGGAYLTLSAAAAQLVGVVAAPLLTRLYSPSDMGAFAVYGSVLAVLSVVACLRYEVAVVVPSSELKAHALYRLSLACALGVSFVVLLAALLFAESLSDALGFNADARLWLFLCPALLAVGVFNATSAWHLRKQQFTPIAQSKLIQSLPQTAFQLLLGLAGMGAGGLVAGEAIGRSAGAVFLWRRAENSGPESVTSTWSHLPEAAGEYRSFPLISTWSVLLNEVSHAAPAVMLAAWFGPEPAGLYGLVRRVLAMPMDLVGQAARSTFTSEAARLARVDRPALRKFYLRFAGALFVSATIPIALLIAWAPRLFEVVFGSQWTRAGEFAQILAVGLLFRFSLSPLGQILNILELHIVQLRWDAARAVGLLAAPTATYLLGGTVENVLAVYTAIVVAAQVAYFLTALRKIGR